MNLKIVYDFFKLKSFILLGLFSFLSFFGHISAAERAEGVNLVLDVVPDARSLALGDVYLGMPGGLSSVQKNAAQMNSLEGAWLGVSRAALFGDVEYNWLGTSYRLNPNVGIGLALGRMSADGIFRTSEGQIYEGTSAIPTFSIADNYMSLSGFWARDLWSLGLTVHGLYRELDQSGWGLRTDLSGEYNPFSWFSTGIMLQSITSSYASFESGYSEYQSPEMFTGFGFHIPAPYFYGKLNVAWQSAGWFQKKARSVTPVEGRLRSSPLDSADTTFRLAGQRFVHLGEWLSVSGVAAEFNFDAGLSLRAALPELRTPEYFTMGAGIQYKKWLQADYAFENHPELELSHRVSLAINWAYLLKKENLTPKSSRIPIQVQNEPSQQQIDSLSSQNPKNANTDQIKPLDLPQTPSTADSSVSLEQQSMDKKTDIPIQEKISPKTLESESIKLQPQIFEDEREEVIEKK